MALARPISRRRFLAGTAAGLGAAALAASGVRAALPPPPKPGNLAWVWQFDDDGSPELVRSVLAQYGLGIILKTHDGTDWLNKWDHSATAIGGGRDVGRFAAFFEQGGVSFHAWCVLNGSDPIAEAGMCAEVLSSGARTLVFDLEPDDEGEYWQGTPQAALAFGRELRRLQPYSWLSVAPDPRPWQVEAVPMREFASFCNEIAPQAYWNTFDSDANYAMLRDRGFTVGDAGVTPELILDVTHAALGGFGLPLRPVGAGAPGRDELQRFVSHASGLGMDAVSVWRFGTTHMDVWPVIAAKATPPIPLPGALPSLQAPASSPFPYAGPVPARPATLPAVQAAQTPAAQAPTVQLGRGVLGRLSGLFGH